MLHILNFGGVNFPEEVNKRFCTFMGKFKMVVESREKCTGGGFPEVNYSTQLYLYKTKWNIIMKGESYEFFCTLLPEN